MWVKNPLVISESDSEISDVSLRSLYVTFCFWYPYYRFIEKKLIDPNFTILLNPKLPSQQLLLQYLFFNEQETFPLSKDYPESMQQISYINKTIPLV